MSVGSVRSTWNLLTDRVSRGSHTLRCIMLAMSFSWTVIIVIIVAVVGIYAYRKLD